ncbi:glycosyltransferase family 2 protein [Bacteroidota bacterium]
MLANWDERKTKMLLGPVTLGPVRSLFEQIQSQEMLATMGLTGGAAAYGKSIMANGANILFSKAAFNEIGGYERNGNPSGDDVFTMLKMNEKWPKSIDFVKDFRAIVQTKPQANFSAFWQQRKRWLSKKSGYSNRWVKASAVITYAANLSCFIALITVLLNFGNPFTSQLLWLLFVKTILDLMLIRTVRKDLQPDCAIWNILPAEIFIITYISIIGLIGNVRKYDWKGRSINVNG